MPVLTTSVCYVRLILSHKTLNIKGIANFSVLENKNGYLYIKKKNNNIRFISKT